MNYTLDTFANKPRKRMLEKMIATKIFFDLGPGSDRSNGCSAFSLTGPAIMQHLENYEVFLGDSGVLHSIERESEVYTLQLNEIKKHKPSRKRLKHYYGDFFEIVMEEYNRSKHLYIDFDACATMDAILLDHLDDFRALATKFAKHTKKVWLSVTFSLRNRKKSGYEKQLKQISNAFTKGGKGWKQTDYDVYTYADGAPMGTAFWTFER